MKTLLILFSLIIGCISTQAQNTIEVSISNFENNEGKAMIGLYNLEVDFLKKEFKSFAKEITGKQVKVSFENIPDGTYAVSVFHDEDNDNEFDMFLGFIPSEDYGNSNNVSPRFGPPEWNDAKFEVKGGEIKKIKIEIM
ncbi:DUF2141 domain-containing protein [Aequorivita lipolytica]|uniref:DUF2141 domain-containing protein n=1 Tax=Aequorivita lipolytica TaxID=153267 RepID=A0A5C6YPV7_9FLAO|nr:DUF2141 domain-containing protein [Aequorivita lipolytica]TXD69600.1 DUF2141 domain-containing protein [Aequorivita lipolytica]SRX51086.1 hypothetical protein AEQU2_01566 [Aequorivita lipolytica]